jgi:hypothetical protein
VFRHFTGIWFFTREPVGELSLYFFSCITLICFYFELNIYGRLPTIPTKIVPRKKLKGRHWKDEISALTSVWLGSSGDLLLGLQKSAVVTTFWKSAPSISLYADYQYPILHNREFRSLGNRKNYIKSTKATLQGNDVRVYLCLHCTIIFAIFDFLSEIFFGNCSL